MALELITGDDTELFLTLQKQGATFTIDPADAVKAAIVSLDHETIHIAAVSQVSTSTGADWVNSLVAVNFSTTETGVITTYGRALVEIQVVPVAGKTDTWFTEINVIKGNIS